MRFRDLVLLSIAVIFVSPTVHLLKLEEINRIVTEGQLPGLTNRAAIWRFRVQRDAGGAIRYQLVL